MKKVFLFIFVLLTVMLGLSLRKEVKAELLPVVGNPYSYEVQLLFEKTASGEAHTIGLTLDKKVYVWGWNQYGQLGIGNIISSNTAIDITEQLNLNSGEIVTDVAAGVNHSSVITSNGRLITWGHNVYGKLGDGSNVDKLSPIDITSQFSLNSGETIVFTEGGYYFSGAITSLGRVFTWGQGNSGQLGNGLNNDILIPQEITNQFALMPEESIVSLGLGSFHATAITSLGRVFAWGYNGTGQLGDGTTINKNVPVDITASLGLAPEEMITNLQAFNNHTGGVTSSGRILMWGENGWGQLGDGTYTNKSMPIDITSNCNLTSGETVIDLSLGVMHSGALTSNNRVLMWGYNGYYQLGDGTSSYKLLPFDITSRFTLEDGEVNVALALGGYFSKSITSSGRVISWGNNNVGQLGAGFFGATSTLTGLKNPSFTVQSNYLPVTETIIKQALGESFTVLLTSSNRVFTFGLNNFGQLGIGKTTTSLPVDITANFNLNIGEIVTDIYAGNYYVFALTSEKRIFSWGQNNYGQLGNGTTQNKYLPQDVTSYFGIYEPESVIDISLAVEFGLMLTSEGRLMAWGYNTYGQLGDGMTQNKYLPIDVTANLSLGVGEKITKISAGGWHSLVYTTENRMFAWGRNDYGQLGDSSFVQKTLPTDITSNLVLLPAETISQVESRYLTSYTITSEGRILTWGGNPSGQIGDGTLVNKNIPTEITGNFGLEVGDEIIDLDLADQAPIAYSLSGRIFSWGNNFYGSLGDGTTSNKSLPNEITSNFNFYVGETIERVVCGSSHCSLLTSEGRLYIWGNGANYQLGISTSTLTIPYELNKLYNYHNEVILTYTEYEQNHLFSNYDLSILLEYDIPEEITSINVNGDEYTEFFYEKGRIDLAIPNTWLLNDEVLITVNSITFANSIVMNLSGNNTVNLLQVEDTEEPVITFDYEYELYMEESINDVSYLHATSLDDTGDSYPVIITGTYDLTVPGTYELTYTATDSSGNFSTRDRTIVVMPMMNTEGSIYGDFTFYYLSDEVWYSGIDLNNQVLRYNDLNYLTITDNTTFPFELYNNYLT